MASDSSSCPRMLKYNITSTTEHINNLEKWPPSKSVLHHVKGMGLEFYSKEEDGNGLKFPIARSFQLLNELFPYYDSDNKVFVFNEVKLCFGLQDIFYLTALPIHGEAVTGLISDPKVEFEAAFGYKPVDGKIIDKYGNINLVLLRNKFENVGHDSVETTDDVVSHIRAYMLYFLHCFVVPGIEGKASTRYLPLLHDVTNIHKFAWGAASLANIHAELGRIQRKQLEADKNFTKKCKVQIRSQFFPLCLFFFEHIPNLWAVTKINAFLLPTKFPLIAEWSQILHNKLTQHGLDFGKVLENLSEDDVTWKPYDRLERSFIPSSYREMGKFSITRTVLHCFEKCSYHRPDLAPKQFGIQNVDETGLRPMIELRTCSLKGPRGKNFSLHTKKDCNYPQMVVEWQKRMDSDLSQPCRTEVQNDHPENQRGVEVQENQMESDSDLNHPCRTEVQNDHPENQWGVEVQENEMEAENEHASSNETMSTQNLEHGSELQIMQESSEPQGSGTSNLQHQIQGLSEPIKRKPRKRRVLVSPLTIAKGVKNNPRERKQTVL